MPTPTHPSAAEVIAQAEHEHAETQARVKAADRELARLQDGRAEQVARDADAAEQHKTGRRCVKHLTAHRTAVDEADAAVRVALLAAQAAKQALQAAHAEHGAQWRADLEREALAADDARHSAVEALPELHSRRGEAHRKLRAAGGEPASSIGMASFKPTVLLDSVSGERLSQVLASATAPQERHRQRIEARAEDILAALRTISEPETIEAFMPGGKSESVWIETEDGAWEEVNASNVWKHIGEHNRYAIIPRDPVAAGGES